MEFLDNGTERSAGAVEEGEAGLGCGVFVGDVAGVKELVELPEAGRLAGWIEVILVEWPGSTIEEELLVASGDEQERGDLLRDPLRQFDSSNRDGWMIANV